jgi:hypothetical protein
MYEKYLSNSFDEKAKDIHIFNFINRNKKSPSP